MKKMKSTESNIDSLTGRFMKLSKALLFIVVVCASVTVAQATVINVKASPYNAAGDNVADDKTPIQNAINAAAVTGGTVYFPPGLYKVTGTIYVPSNIRLQGIGSTVYNTQIRLTPQNTALFEIVENGASNIVFKDLTLVAASSPNWPRNNATETALIRAENTTGISFLAGSRGISDVVIENVRITMFTKGLSATSTAGTNRPVTDVKIRNYASDGNEYSLYTNTTGADDWDVQNMNVYPMYDGQNGIFLERSGAMRFLELSCAGSNAGVCVKLWGNGDTYFRQMHVEGPRLGICVGGNCIPSGPAETIEENSSKVTIENSATNGEFHRFTNLDSINNRFWIDFGTPPVSPPPYTFYGTGVNSALMYCGDVWVSWDPTLHMTNTTVTPPTGTFSGLVPAPQQCLRSGLTSVPVFNTGYEADNDRLTAGEVNVTAYGAVPNDVGDDTTAFVNAIAASALPVNRGKRVFVPAGTFNISSTLDLSYDGQIIVGEEGSIVHLTGSNLSLFRILNRYGYPINGIALRNLVLTSDSTVGTFGINFENWDASLLGAASDFQIQNVDAHGFEAGIVARPVNGDITNANPMFDSVSVKDGDFSGNKTAILIRSANASNWNLENIRADIPNGQEGIRIDKAGHVSVRNLPCTGYGSGAACVTIQRQGDTSIENVSSTGVLNTLVVPWENGWTQFPITVRNSDLREGVYFQGKTYLNSVNNIYPAKLSKFSSARDVKFGALYEGNPLNVAYGGQSKIFTCDDVFRDIPPLSVVNYWVYIGTLSTPEVYCH